MASIYIIYKVKIKPSSVLRNIRVYLKVLQLRFLIVPFTDLIIECSITN